MKLKDIKNFKYWGRMRKIVFIADIVRKVLWLALGVGLYVLLNNTGLLIYIICNLWLRWHYEDLDL
jgi:hypothetical protein